MSGTTREGRLRPEYASLYPAIVAGVWTPASRLGQQLLLGYLVGPAVPLGERVMSDEHFEFRGAERRIAESANVRSRATD